MRKKVTVITVEKERVIEIHWRGQRRESLCQQCGIEVRMLTPDEAAVLVGVTPRMVCGWAEAGRVHFTKNSDGLPLVCLDSLGRSGLSPDKGGRK